LSEREQRTKIWRRSSRTLNFMDLINNPKLIELRVRSIGALPKTSMNIKVVINLLSIRKLFLRVRWNDISKYFLWVWC